MATPAKKHAAGWATDAPSPAQLKELFAQIESGRINGTRLQSFLNWKEPKIQPRHEEPLTTLDDDVVALVRTWDEKFPDKGQLIMERLAPFYSPNFSLRLKPPAKNLEERVRKAFYWQHNLLGDIHIMHDWRGVGETYYEPPEAVEWVTPRSIRVQTERISPVTTLYENPPINAVSKKTEHICPHECWEKIWDLFSHHFQRTGELVREELRIGFIGALTLATYATILNTEPFYQDLLDLWRSGNLPAFLTRHKSALRFKFYVLCAK